MQVRIHLKKKNKKLKSLFPATLRENFFKNFSDKKIKNYVNLKVRIKIEKNQGYQGRAAFYPENFGFGK
ncbi:exported protein of unknown function [Ruminococcaceae bacterium BL-6]|nr:exported protein of unknown function [Ruminococcaceae bacterium BL-6]